MKTRSMPAPIEQLPEDITREIFLLCLPEDRWRTTLIASEAPVLLTHVCGSWRRVAVGFSLLWKCLQLDLDLTGVKGPSITILQEFIQRAHPAPLNLQFSIIHDLKQPPTRNSRALSRLLRPCYQTLTRLALENVPIPALRALPAGQFPSLERLALRFSCDGVTPVDTPSGGPITAFSDAPSLLRVAIGGWEAATKEDYSLYCIPLPFHQLTHFMETYCGDEGTQFFPTFFEKCTHLEYLATELQYEQVASRSSSFWASSSPVCLDTLQSLFISFWPYNAGEFAYPGFFDKMEFPNLKHLLFEGGKLDFDDDEHWPEGTVSKFLAKLESLDNLSYLSINHSEIDLDTLESIFRSTPNVTTLDAYVYRNYEWFFDVLNTSYYPDILPKLQTLSLEVGHSAAVDDGCSEFTIDEEEFLANVIDTRICPDASGRQRITKVVVYADEEEKVEDWVPFIDLILDRSPNVGFLLERRIIDPDYRQLNALWLDRAPGLKDWPEMFVCYH